MEILKSLGIQWYLIGFLVGLAIISIGRAILRSDMYKLTDDEKNLLNELLDNAFDEAEIFGDAELKQDIYILKQKIKR